MELAEEVPIASTSCADPDNSVWGGGVLKTFVLSSSYFTEGQTGLSLKAIGPKPGVGGLPTYI